MDSVFKTTLRAELDFQDITTKELSARTGISVKAAYGAIGAERSTGVSFGAVAFENFIYQAEKLATLSSRNTIKEFAVRLESEIGTEAAGEALASVATDSNFEALLHYNKADVEATHISSVINKIRANVGNLTIDDIMDKMDFINE